MGLRGKLFLVGLVLLVLPWAAWRYLQETERFLRQGEERALQLTAAVLAQSLASEWPAHADDAGLYVRAAPAPIRLDGYADEWRPWLQAAQAPEDGTARLALAEHRDTLYLLRQVEDPLVRYSRSGGAQGDRLLVALEGADGQLWHYTVAAEAPGWLRAEPGTGGPGPALEGQWQELSNGYSVELTVPLEAAPRALGVAVVDVDRDSAAAAFDEFPLPRPLVRPARFAAPMLTVPPSSVERVWVVDRQGWMLTRRGELRGSAGAEDSWRWLRSVVYRYLLAPPFGELTVRDDYTLRLEGTELDTALAGQAASRWQPALDEATLLLSAAAPVVREGRVVGAVVVEQAGDALLILANRALVGLMGSTFIAFALALAVLLGFATRLSLRVRRLRNAAEEAVGREAATRFPLSRDRDELGDLSRSFAHAMGELREYARYLQGLASKLSHELKTPPAVVDSSLHNLEQYALTELGRRYLARAQSGNARLAGILRAMSEARRLEQSLSREEAQCLDLGVLLRSCAEAYQDLAAPRQVALSLPDGACEFYGSPELLVQMLDKLIDNALGFTPPDGWIRLQLEPGRDGYLLRVANQGPPLPETLRGRLFDSMVSLRGGEDGRPHLGLGLYIVRLIAELHRGAVAAVNVDQGVEFRIQLGGMEAPTECADQPLAGGGPR